MTQITKEAIEAAVTKAMGWQPSETGPSYQETRAEVLAALSTLPIAGEGKVKQLEWREDSTSDGREQWHSSDRECITVMGRSFADHERYWLFHAQKGFPSLQEAKAAAQADFETRILSALISSPGKDGGQGPVGTGVFENGEMVGFIGLGDEFNPDPERPRDTRPIFTTPQPASTALVERLKERGQAFANQVRLITHLLHGQAYSTTVAELNAFDAALSASTSREGESRG